MVKESGGCRWDLGASWLEPGANGWGARVFMTKRLEARAEEDGEQRSGSLAMGDSAPPRQCLPLALLLRLPPPNRPQTEGGDGFICCLVMSLVTTKEEAH